MQRIDLAGQTSAHYSIFQLEDIEEVFKFFSDHGPDEMNWLFTGTGGVHGDQTDVRDLDGWIDRVIIRGAPPPPDDLHITVLIVQPRLVCMRYGTLAVNREQAQKLIELQQATGRILSKLWGPQTDE